MKTHLKSVFLLFSLKKCFKQKYNFPKLCLIKLLDKAREQREAKEWNRKKKKSGCLLECKEWSKIKEGEESNNK